MAQPDAALRRRIASSSERIASLNKDGSQTWFIPPYVIPLAIVTAIAARAIWLS